MLVFATPLYIAPPFAADEFSTNVEPVIANVPEL